MIAPGKSRVSAFSLIELLVVISIMAILVTLSVVGIGDGGRSQRLTASGNRVIDLVNLARQTAKARNSMSMLLVVTKGDRAYRAITVLEKPLDATSWKQVAPWEVLPDGISIAEDESEAFLKPPVAALNPAPPALSMSGQTLAPSDYAWQVFLPSGQLLSDQSAPPVLYLRSLAQGGTAANYYSITINANTGIPLIRRP